MIPEKRSELEEDDYSFGYAQGWNACVDAVSAPQQAGGGLNGERVMSEEPLFILAQEIAANNVGFEHHLWGERIYWMLRYKLADGLMDEQRDRCSAALRNADTGAEQSGDSNAPR